MQIVFLIFLFIVGACFGSFLCCQARRLHLKSKKSQTKLSQRSICLNCRRQLKWYDNLPILSWLILRGKCRHCHHKIGYAELLSELGFGLAVLCLGVNFDCTTTSFLTWASFITVIVFAIIIGFLAIYDGLYGELPTRFLMIAIFIAIINLVIQEVVLSSSSPFSITFITDPIISFLILGGLYLILYLVSKGKWVGDGDWLLGSAIALVLFRPWLALICLFLANILACLIMAPAMKGKKTHQIYFGPFLVIAFVITYSLSNFLLFLISG